MFTLTVDEDIELQLFELRHATELYWLVDSNRLYLREWLPWVDHMTSPAAYHGIIPMWLKQFADNNGFNLGIRYKGHLVGSIGLHQIDWNNAQTSIGYYLAQNAQGKGIMTRTVKALLNHCFFVLGLNRVEIRCGVGNHKSRAIPERLGFVREGVIRDGENLYGSYHDLILYSMLEREWSNLIHKR
ncbi:GNAT family N-acetyltransferase [Mesobacillus maritimus]|uniref:GNAT family N-acetyltransferase n=1 Tax=Mesobacillus maritimus TaxID=1643336 RepID=UPI00203BD1A2|nr:GNAT family protein [Mesobacillus maritimus]MCM3671738.1 GNAT family N-acetyltransferase [Mesobacillus maritimus]